MENSTCWKKVAHRHRTRDGHQNTKCLYDAVRHFTRVWFISANQNLSKRSFEVFARASLLCNLKHSFSTCDRTWAISEPKKRARTGLWTSHCFCYILGVLSAGSERQVMFPASQGCCRLVAKVVAFSSYSHKVVRWLLKYRHGRILRWRGRINWHNTEVSNWSPQEIDCCASLYPLLSFISYHVVSTSPET